MKTAVIGDIHGGLLALKELLNNAPLEKNTTLIFLGDYVDGWSQSFEVLDLLIHLKKERPCIFLRGNHDDLLYRYLKYGETPEKWLEHGGKSSIKSYTNRSEAAVLAHIKFLESLEYYYIDAQQRLFVHAGFANMHGPQHEYYPNTVYWDRSLWEMACALDPSLNPQDLRYPQRLKLFKEIFIGHTPVTRMDSNKPLNFANVWNIDTGAAFKGCITLLDVDSKAFWQSTPVYKLYPEENGRN